MVGTELFEEKMLEFTRRRDPEKLNVLQGLDKKILKSHLEKILKNDKSVWGELFLPKWMTWDLLRSWAAKYEKPDSKCVFCEQKTENGKIVQGKTVCGKCVEAIKAE